jgi:hypothetical protein
MDYGVGWPVPGFHTVVGTNRGEQLGMQGYARDGCTLLNQDRRHRLENRVYRLPFLEARILFSNHVVCWSICSRVLVGEGLIPVEAIA